MTAIMITRMGLSSTAIHSLAWALLHFVWQGAALAALAAGAMALCRKASSRYIIGVGALLLMWLAPFATIVISRQPHPASPNFARPLSHFQANWPAFSAEAVRPSQLTSPSSFDALPWLVDAWLLGVTFFSIRSAGGFLLVERERRRRSSVVSDRMLSICHSLQEIMGIKRIIEYCECEWLQAPAVFGWFRPVVFLPVTALTGLSEEQLRSVIAHELAHIRRFDAFVNVFQVCVEIVLFYHPAVWWLNKRIRSEREHCCDETAVLLCGDAVEYARALTLMEQWRSAPALSMAANHGSLRERIIRVLGLNTFGAGARGIGLAASVLCFAGAIAAGNALLGLAHPASVSASPSLHAQIARFAGAAAQSAPAAKPSPSHAQSNASSQASEPAHSSSATSYIDAMQAAGLGSLTADQLIVLKTQDVTPEYVRDLRQQGLHLDVNKVVAMRIQGVTPEYIRELHEAGLNPDEDQLIALRIQDVDAKYCAELKQAGVQADVNRLIAMKIQGVTPEYVRDLRAVGINANADQLVSLRIQDVTPEYLKAMHEQGIDLKTDEAISMRIQDVTPDYVRDIHALGLKPSAQELISMRIQDVTPEYVKALQSAGFKLSVNDIISAKIQDVTPEFIDQARKHGFADLSLQKLIQLRQLGILDSKADI